MVRRVSLHCNEWVLRQRTWLPQRLDTSSVSPFLLLRAGFFWKQHLASATRTKGFTSGRLTATKHNALTSRARALPPLDLATWPCMMNRSFDGCCRLVFRISNTCSLYVFNGLWAKVVRRRTRRSRHQCHTSASTPASLRRRQQPSHAEGSDVHPHASYGNPEQQRDKRWCVAPLTQCTPGHVSGAVATL